MFNQFVPLVIGLLFAGLLFAEHDGKALEDSKPVTPTAETFPSCVEEYVDCKCFDGKCFAGKVIKGVMIPLCAPRDEGAKLACENACQERYRCSGEEKK